MAKYGAGTSKTITIGDGFKCTIGTVSKSSRPESVYMNISTWCTFSPSLIDAVQSNTQDVLDLTIKSAASFRDGFRGLDSRFSAAFDPTNFIGSTLIYTITFDPKLAKPGKAIPFEIEFSLETTNEIDADENPVPGKDGRLHKLSFSDLTKPLTVAGEKIAKILNGFTKYGMQFSATKPAGAITEGIENWNHLKANNMYLHKKHGIVKQENGKWYHYKDTGKNANPTHWSAFDTPEEAINHAETSSKGGSVYISDKPAPKEKKFKTEPWD